MCLGAGGHLELTGETAPPSGAASYHLSWRSQGNLGSSREPGKEQFPGFTQLPFNYITTTSPHLLPRLPGKKITLLKLEVFTSSEKAENKPLIYVLDLRKPGLLIK